MIQKYTLYLIVFVLFACAEDSNDSLDIGPGTGTGVGGSTARFVISGDHLYLVDHSSMKLIDIEDPKDPIYQTTINLGWGIETIYSYKENLFIGGQSGMQIFSIADPAHPEYVSAYSHQTACDPVIANDRYAYVTIRDGVSCNAGEDVNRLITLDIDDLYNPIEVDVDRMINPRGLTFFQGSLYVGEGKHGMKKFDLSNPANPKLDTFYTQIAANDMIGLPHTMIITRDDGILQYGVAQDSILLYSTLKR